MLPWSDELAGRLEKLQIESEVLRDNPLGDPATRPLWVYLPPGYDDDPDARFPTIYVIQGYSGHLQMWENRAAFRRTFPETADEVFANGAPPCVVVYVDAWTTYGGSQFVDSPGTGRYHTYLCDEVVAFVDARFRTIDDPRSRAITGKSSGGYGAMITAMLRPDVFGALASHAGDSLHELCYIADFAKAVRALRPYDGDIAAWWADFQERLPVSRPDDMTLVMIYGVAACYSADEDGTPVLPFDPHTGQLRPAVWQRWLDVDPVRMVPGHSDAVAGLEAVWLDAGSSDEFFLDLGAQAFRDAVLAAGLPEERLHFELFEGGHGGIDHRYPLALDWLARRLPR